MIDKALPKKPCNKGSPKFAIPQRVADIALQYGSNVSEGIQKMEEIISGKHDYKQVKKE